jgi:hypothetical protein
MELQFGYATPELKNSNTQVTNRGDRREYWSFSYLYYPWGDSAIRPYWRGGIGNMNVDYPTDFGSRYDASLFMFPWGAGVKWQLRRWLAARVELTDYFALGTHGVNAQSDWALTFGLEWHFGTKHKSYWPWNPSRQLW